MQPHNFLPPARIVALGGPVSLALAAMRSDTHGAEVERLRSLRRAIADRIEADLALLDEIDGDADIEGDYVTIERASNGSLFTLGRSTDDELCAGDQPEVENEHGGDICDEPHDAESDFPAPEWPCDGEHHFTPVRGALPRRAPPASAFLPAGGA